MAVIVLTRNDFWFLALWRIWSTGGVGASGFLVVFFFLKETSLRINWFEFWEGFL